MGDPSSDGFPRRFGNLELDGPLGLLLQHDTPGGNGLSLADIPHLNLTRSQARSLLSIARLNKASSRRRSASCRRMRIAQISLSLRGVFWPMSLPLFQGGRRVPVVFGDSIAGSCSDVAGKSAPLRNVGLRVAERPTAAAQPPNLASVKRPLILAIVLHAQYTVHWYLRGPGKKSGLKLSLTVLRILRTA
jgi:hypothetical protein